MITSRSPKILPAIRRTPLSSRNGPIAKGTCEECGGYFTEDIYAHDGRTLCGECRYIARHGHPPRDRRIYGGVSSPHSPPDVDAWSGMSVAISRTIEFDVGSPADAAVLETWLDTCSLSLS